MSVAEAAQAGSQYWIVGAILGAVLVVILIIVLIYLVGRNRQKPNEQKDVAVGHSPTLPQSDKTSRISRPQLVSRASQSSSKPTAPKMVRYTVKFEIIRKIILTDIKRERKRWW